MKIGLDVMGGDVFPNPQLVGAMNAWHNINQEAQIFLIGNQALINDELERLQCPQDRFRIIHTDEYIGMSESARMLLQKPKASIRLGAELIKGGELDCFISAGNTGAMVAASVIGLGALENVMRPTIGGFYPINDSYAFVCDVGANVDCKPELLEQFAIIGSVFMREVMGMPEPRVALLNVGEERSKGNLAVQQAYALLEKRKDIHFVGNAEGRDLIKGKADVYVCDGFVGNIMLKFAESFYPFMKAIAPDSQAIESFNYEAIGALPILGVQGNMLIAHGSSNATAYANMFLRAVQIVKSNLTQKISFALAKR